MPQAGGYDAFISYSHMEDDVLAAALQAGLERFARPWYRPRALRVFRDTSNLAATPALWSDIVRALSASDWFVLVASPTAANSRWVRQEVEWWLANKKRSNFLIALSDGNIKWSGEDFDWQRTDCLPEELSAAFAEEPRWVDLHKIRETLAGANAELVQSMGPRRLRQRQLRDQVGDWVADIAAPIRGLDKDGLVGEHLRYRRRTRRTVQAAVSILAALTLAASAAAAIAVNQRDLARTQTRIATSREVAALAVANLSTNLNVAELLAVAAYRMDRNPETEAALFQAVAGSAQLVRYLQVGATVSALGSSANGNVIVAGTTDGHLVWFDSATGSRLEVKALNGTVENVAVSDNGQTVVAADGSSAVVWQAARGHLPEAIGKASSVAVSPSGQLAAILDIPPGSSAGSYSMLTIRNIQSGRESQARVSGEFLQLYFSDPSTLTLANGGGPSEQLALPNLRRISGSTEFVAPAGGYTTGASPGGGYSAYVKYGDVTAWPTVSANILHDSLSGLAGFAPDAPASALAISSDGKWAATVESGIIYVGSLETSPSATGTGTALAASADTSSVIFLGSGDDRLVSAADDTLALWNLAQTSRFSRATGISIPESGTIGYPPKLLFSPNGQSLALTYSFGGGNIYDSRFRLEQAIRLASGSSPLWRGTQLLSVGNNSAGDGIQIANDRGQLIRQWEGRESSSDIASMRILPGGSRLAVIDGLGGVTVYNMQTGAVRQIRADGSPSTSSVFSQRADISADGGAAAFSATGSGRVVYVNLQTGASHVVGAGGADGVVFTRNRLLIQRTSDVLQIWDLAGLHLLQSLRSPGLTDAVAVSPDGLLVARLRDDGTASISDLATGDVLATFSLPFPEHTIAVDPWAATTMTFTPDGRSLLTASSGGELISWDLYPPDLEKIACAIAGQSLTVADWQAYVHTSPPPDLSCAH